LLLRLLVAQLLLQLAGLQLLLPQLAGCCC
jgi:hypothetical protein